MANIKVNIDVESGDVEIASDKVLTLQQQIRILRQELQKTPEGTKEFNLLVNKLNDTRDAFDRVNIKGKEIFGTLGLIPGPIGEIAARTNSAIDALKIFGSFKATDIKAQFSALGNDIKDAGKTLGQLTGITQLYTVVTNASSKALQFFGVSLNTANVAGKALGVTIAALTAATGLIVLVGIIGQLSEAWDNFSNRAENAAKAAEKAKERIVNSAKAGLDAETAYIEQTGELLVAEAKLRGASAKEIYDIEQQNRELSLASLKRYYEEVKNTDFKEAQATQAAIKKKNNDIKIAEANFKLEQLNKNKEQNKKISDDNAKAAADAKALRDKELAELKAGRDEAFLEKLTDQQAEEYKATEHYVKLIDLAIKYGQDTAIFEEALLKQLQEIRDKYKKVEQDKVEKANEEKLTKQKEYDDFLREQYEQIDQLNQQRVDNEIAANDAITQSWINLGNNIAGVFGSLANVFGDNEVLAKAFAVAQIAINTASSIGSIILNGKQQQAEYNKAIAAGNATIGIGIANAFIPGLQGLAAAQIASGKTAVAGAIAGKAVAKANTTGQVIAAGVAGAAQIAAVLSAKKSSPSSSGGDSGGGGSNASIPAFSNPTIGAPQIGATGTQQGTIAGIVAGSLQSNNSSDRPIRAYVVGNDITSEMQLQRRIRTAARLGG